jgi:hypothetical protein
MGWPGPLTHRQYLAWHEWLLMKANRPSTTEYYLMGIRQEIRQVNSKKGHTVKMEDMIIPFARRTAKDDNDDAVYSKDNSRGRKMTAEEASAIGKAVWAKRIGGNIKHVVISREEAIARGMMVPPLKESDNTEYSVDPT